MYRVFQCAEARRAAGAPGQLPTRFLCRAYNRIADPGSHSYAPIRISQPSE
jgi:hypothetical protein